MKKSISTFIFFAVIVFIVNSKSLGLTLYADDWIIMAKYFAIFGAGKIFPVWRIDMWFADYGFQNITPVLYTLVGPTHWVYFAVNLFFKSLATFSIYFFSKNTLNEKVGLLAGIFYAAGAGGVETTDWVYNMATYLGIFIALMGLTFFVKENGLRLIFWWVVAMFGYTVGSLRLFIIPPLLVLLGFFKGAIGINKTKLLRGVGMALVLLLLLFLYREPFPHLSSFNDAKIYVGTGLNTSRNLLESGRSDFLVYPLTIIGFMLVPHGLDGLMFNGWKVYPIQNFIVSGILLAIISTIFIALSFGKKIGKKELAYSFVLSVAVLLALKLFVRYQGDWGLRDFSKFSGTYFGAIFLVICVVKIVKTFRKRSFRKLSFYLLTFFVTVSLLFPQVVNPGTIFNADHRYLAFCFVGVSLFLADILSFRKFDSTSLIYLKGFLIGFVLLLNIVEVDRFYTYQLTARTPKLEKLLFDQIRNLVPDYPQDAPVIFYFDYPYYKTYYDLLYSSFGYHMQLMYGKTFDEKNIPGTVSTYEKLKEEIRLRGAPFDHIYALFWENGKFVDRSLEIRERLSREENEL